MTSDRFLVLSFKVSDILSGLILTFTIILLVASFIVPTVTLITTTVLMLLLQSPLGMATLFCFLMSCYLSYRHNMFCVIGHVITLLMVVLIGGPFIYLYFGLLLVFITPWVVVYRRALNSPKID